MTSAIRIWTIASNTVREAIRNKLLYVLLLFAVGLILAGVMLSSLSYVESERILQDVGLASVRLFGVAIAIFVGVNLIHKEVERRTVYTILSKPLSRVEFLLGKYVGLVLTIWMQAAIMIVAFVLVSLASGAPLTAGHAAAFLLIAVELALVVAVATLFSAFTTPMLASFFSAGVWVVGHMTRTLRDIGAQSDLESIQKVTGVLHRVLPDLESFNLTVEAAHGLPVTASDVLLPLVYGMGYVSILLVGAVLLFERRDFR
jgi:ABC-type transport system involved in multi-copper enzyme maturation permease subunit